MNALRRTIESSDNPAVVNTAKVRNNGRYNGNGREWDHSARDIRPAEKQVWACADPETGMFLSARKRVDLPDSMQVRVTVSTATWAEYRSYQSAAGKWERFIRRMYEQEQRK